MPQNTACKVVMSFRSLDVTLLKTNALDQPSVSPPGLRSAQRSAITSAYRGAQMCLPIKAALSTSKKPAGA
jgi:hypothetical protein